MAIQVVETPDPNILVVDGLLEHPEAYRAEALKGPFASHTLGLATFHGIALAPSLVSDWITETLPICAPTLSFFRQSPAGQIEPNFIHSDRSMGAWTALLYLTPDPPEGDGTTFWERTDTGARLSESTSFEDYAAEGPAWTVLEHWQPWYRVPAVFNRLVLFPAPYYHSRALKENYGVSETARLVQVTFGGYGACQ